MKYILLIIAAGMNSLISGAADAREIKLYPDTLEVFNTSILRYDQVAESAGISQDTGLAKIYHDIRVEGVGKVAQDPKALQEAERLNELLRKNKGILSLLLCTNGSLVTVKEYFEGISILAQKDFLLAIHQEGFDIKLPKGDLGKLFAEKSDENLVKQFLELNVAFPTTPEAVAVVRGSLIAKYYIMQRCYEGFVASRS